jgi:hypothetical protein
MKKMIVFALAGAFLLSFAHCGKDDKDVDKPNPLGKNYGLYDKWWYNQGQNRGDHLFKANDSTGGEFEWIHPNLMTSKGTYQWYPTGDSMLVTITGYEPLSFAFQFVTLDSMGYIPGNEANLGNVYRFKTTKP